MNNIFPVIDMFAGPGGLGEGFSAYTRNDDNSEFKIQLSIEKDIYAHKTLELRSFFRQFPDGEIPPEYYNHIRGEIPRAKLFSFYPSQARSASQESWLATLGEVAPEIVDKRIERALKGKKRWVLIGGPPCQAYSMIGRARIGGIKEDDPRVFLYREYMRILARHAPPVFVMENVKGLLSSRVKGSLIFEQILKDLQSPSSAFIKLKGKKKKYLHDVKYNIYSFVKEPEKDIFGIGEYQHQDFVIHCEDYGIPQTRHRVILLGIREDLRNVIANLLNKSPKHISVSQMLSSLPRLRSGLSREYDSEENWLKKIRESLNQPWLSEVPHIAGHKVYEKIIQTVTNLRRIRKGRGNEYVYCRKKMTYMRDWFHDPELDGACNHTTKAHMTDDLYRYLYVSCFGKVHKRSPLLVEFPKSLLPNHRNAKKKLRWSNFADRFRVQLSERPCCTITSHLSKDGHYYIHPDPSQCRSLTVREAARLQTFPDNYFFCGPRTQQYIQVGNAVPPLLAKQIAEIISDVIKSAFPGI
ncbi:DNA cytosine methyltransferase [Thermodesulfobacteriota bacterium]